MPLGDHGDKLYVSPEAVKLVGQLKRVMPTTHAGSEVGLCAPDIPLTWPQLILQMQHYMNVGLIVTPHENRQGYDIRIPEGWTDPTEKRTDSGLVVIGNEDWDEPAPRDVVHQWDLRMQYAQSQVEQSKDLVWEQAWQRALVALPDPQPLGPLNGLASQLQELEDSYQRRVANMAQVIKNLSQALESSGKATAEWRGKYEDLLGRVQRCPAGSSCYLPDLED